MFLHMSYDLFLSRDYFVFACAHFVIGENFFEPLHGHNYKIKVNVFGEQGTDNMVLDFHDIKEVVKPIVDELDHHVLLPASNKHIKIIEKGEQIIFKVPRLNKEYEFPKEDVIILPIENTTVEEMSHYFIKMLQGNNAIYRKNIDKITITVTEYEGQGVTCELIPSD